jgi:hypothetical protein
MQLKKPQKVNVYKKGFENQNNTAKVDARGRNAPLLHPFHKA